MEYEIVFLCQGLRSGILCLITLFRTKRQENKAKSYREKSGFKLARRPQDLD